MEKYLDILNLQGNIYSNVLSPRMILGLIVLQKNYFISLVNDLCGFYGEDKRGFLEENFKNLAKCVPETYEQQNQGPFKHALQVFAEKILALN